jgi:RNA polymerase sigma factor (sigma-70 family)
MKKVNISQLGRDFQKTKSEKTFKLLFDACKPGVMRYFQRVGVKNSIESIEDAYTETMISIWKDIDKLDVTNYSISTMVFLKTKQQLIRTSTRNGVDFINLDISESFVESMVENSDNSEQSYCLEDDYIKEENITGFWGSVQRELNNPISFEILFDKYALNMSTKDIAKKYNENEQNVLNRVFNAKKKLLNTKGLYEYIR